VVSIALVWLLAVSSGGLLSGCDSGPQTANTGVANTPSASFQTSTPLTVDEVRTIIAQAVTQAVASNVRATIAVLDRGGTVLGVFQMTNARTDTVIGSSSSSTQGGLEGVTVPATLAAISKAGTGAFLSSNGNAFSTRTASDIIQAHRPVTVQFTPGGPLFGVQFSNLPCTDIKIPALPLGLAGDPGGMPLYKNSTLVGGIGVEVDGRYTIDPNPFDLEQPVEELIAVAGARGFEAPTGIRSEQILLDGVRLPYSNVTLPPSMPTLAFAALPGVVVPVILPAATFFDGTIRGTTDPMFGFAATTVSGLAVRMAVDQQGQNRFPFRNSTEPAVPVGLTAQDVETIVIQGLQTASRLRAAIREPEGSVAQVSVFVVDTAGIPLGALGTPDAPFFGLDVAAQKARVSAFFSGHTAGNDLRAAGLGRFVDAAQRDGIALDGSIAFSARALGFLHRPFFPDGIDGTPPGPFSTALPEWSPFNVGLQLEAIQEALFTILTGGHVPLDATTQQPRCSSPALRGLQNGPQIFAGSVPLYKNGQLVGGVGVSGDGIDQDDNVALGASKGFEAPTALRSDQVTVRNSRLPFVKLPRNPDTL
jgi:uncharacterized protein GlcG (DUF336 family)